MEFWGVEVKRGENIVVQPSAELIVHLSQACLGEVKKDKANLSVCVYAHIGDQKFVLGTLSAEKFPQLAFDLVFEKEFVLSHNWKNGSVYFSGYRAPVDAGISNHSDSAINFGEPLPQIGNAAARATEGIPSSSRGIGKPGSAPNSKSRLVKPDSDSSDDSDEFDSDDGNDNEEMHVTKVKKEEKSKGVKGDESDEEDESDEDESDEEDEETPKKAAPSNKRPADSVTKTPAPDKKVKLVTPKTTDTGKKGVVHVATPYPSKQAAKNANNEKSKTQATTSTATFKCNPCNRSFNSEAGLQSHTKAKHGATK